MTDRQLGGIEVEADLVGASRALAGLLAEIDTTSLAGGMRVLVGLVAEADVLLPVAAMGRTYAMWW